MNESKPADRPRVWRLQFSLKLLLLAFTAFAIGFPIWYRWPYEEVVDESPPGSPKLLQRISTWQRQWGGGRLKHGQQRLVEDGKTVESLYYRNGLRHGPFESTHDRGQFENDQKEGVWTAPNRTTTWRRGKLDGLMVIRLPPPFPSNGPNPFSRKAGVQNGTSPAQEPRVLKFMFVQGRLTEFDGKPAANRLFDLLESESIDRRTDAELRKLTTIDVVEMPLRDIVLYLTEMHNLPIVLDPKALPQGDTPITNELRGVDLCSALMVLTAPHDVGCDYRYGCIWITTGGDCKDWQDPTGISEIKPPKGSLLDRVWNEPAVVDVVQTPLADVLTTIQQQFAIEIDTSQIPKMPAGKTEPVTGKPKTRVVPAPSSKSASSSPTSPADPFAVTGSMRGVPLRHVLGRLLYQTGCHCRVEGEKLVILPPEEMP